MKIRTRYYHFSTREAGRSGRLDLKSVAVALAVIGSIFSHAPD